MFGSMSANLLNLISTGFININIDVIFLDVIFNTSKYTSLHINMCLRLLAVSCNDYMHPSCITFYPFYIFPSISFPPPLPLPPSLLPFLLSSLLPSLLPFLLSSLLSCVASHCYSSVVTDLLSHLCLCGYSLSTLGTHCWILILVPSVS